MKKGFTLAELMGIVVIIGILAIIIIPNIERGIDLYKQSSYNSQIRTITMAANNFSIDNIQINSISEDEAVYLSLDQLKISGYLEENIINPITGENFSGDTLIKVTRVDNIFEFEVITDEYSEYASAINVSLIGDLVQYICQHSAYIEKGVNAYDDNGFVAEYEVTYTDSFGGTLISLDDVTSGVYYVRYRVTTDQGASTIIRTVIVRESECSNIKTTDPSCFTVDGSYIIDYNEDCGSNVIIPYSIDGEFIRGISEHSFESKEISNVRIPSIVNNIMDYAFNNNNLEFINLPVEINHLGRNAFSNNNIDKVILLSGIGVLSEEVFKNNNIRNLSFSNNLLVIEASAFENNQIVNIEFPNSITSILESAFRNNNIEKVELSNNLLTIDNNAFRNNNIIQGNATIDNDVASVNEGNSILNDNGDNQNEDIFLVYLREYPSITIDPNGEDSWSDSHFTIVTTNGYHILEKEYTWSNSSDVPSIFENTFTGGDIITTPVDYYCGDYYLHVRAHNRHNNETIESSNRFRFDNGTPSAPEIIGVSDFWVNNDVTISINETSTCSGVEQTEYRINSGSWQTYEDPIVISSNGIYEIDARTRNNASTYSMVSSETVRIDQTLPSITYSPNSRTSWNNTNVSVSVSVSDDISGTNTVRRRLSSNNGSSYGSWTNESGNFNVNLTSDGEFRIQTEVCDNAGNCRTSTSGVYRIDKTSPSVSCSPSNRTSWDNTNVSVSVNVSDSMSGINTIRRRTSSNNGSSWGSWTNESGNFSVNFTGEGERRLNVEVTDNAGNSRTINCGPYRIDKTNPSISFSPNSRTTWNNTNVSVSVNVSDGLSGVDTVRRRTSSNNGSSYGSWTNESGNFSVNFTGQGERRLQVQVCDNAGNCRTSTSGVYRIDKTAPTISHSPNSRTSWDNTNVRVYATITDSRSGVATVRRRYSSNNGSSYGSWNNGTGDYNVNLTGEGERRVQTEACDNAGNCRTVTTGTIRIDKTAPSISYSPNSRTSWNNTNVSVSATISDSLSGVDTIRRRTSSNNGSSYGSWRTHAGNFTVNFTGEGERRLRTEACDNAGNCRTVTSGVYRIDKTAPTVSFSPNSRTSWSNTNPSVSVTISDNLSGIDTIRRRLSTNNGSSYGSWANRSGNFTQGLTASGERRIQVNTCDNAGNCRTSTSGVYRLDFSTPSISFSPNGSTVWRRSQSTTLSGSPGVSGQNFFRYIWSTASSGVSNSTIQYNHTSGGTRTNSSGTRTIYLWARMCDNAGNCRTSRSNGFRLDNTAPTIGAITCGYKRSTSTFSVWLNATDGHSGVNQTCVTYLGVRRCRSGTGLRTWTGSNPGGSMWISERRATDNAGNLRTAGGITCTVNNEW